MSAQDYLWCTDDFDDTQGHILSYSNLFSAFFGLFGSGFVVVHFLLNSKGYVFSHIIFHLSLANFGSSLPIVISQIWLLIDDYDYPICVILRSFIEFFFVAAILWTCVIGIYLYKSIVIDNDVFISERAVNLTFRTNAHKSSTTKFLFMAHMFSWAPPLIFVIVLTSFKAYYRNSGGWCTPNRPYEIAFWEVPIVASFVFDVLLYVIIFIVLRKRRKSKATDRITIQVQKKLTLFLLAYFACFWPDVAAHVVKWVFAIFDHKCNIFWLYWLQNFFVPLQGFLNMIVYTLANREVRSHYTALQIILLFFISPLLVIPAIIFFFYVSIRTAAAKGEKLNTGGSEFEAESESEDDYQQVAWGYSDSWGDYYYPED